MSTLHSYTLLESIVYKLQEKGAIVDPCVVDDLITCIKTTKKVEYNKIDLVRASMLEERFENELGDINNL